MEAKKLILVWLLKKMKICSPALVIDEENKLFSQY
jgi:hypothetical protein